MNIYPSHVTSLFDLIEYMESCSDVELIEMLNSDTLEASRSYIRAHKQLKRVWKLTKKHKSNTIERKTDMRSEIIAVAKSQLGYKEGNNNDTVYGAWYGLNFQPWCAMFVSWCANKAGINTDIFPRFALCSNGIQWFKQRGQYTNTYKGVDIGDVIFFGETEANSTHVGLVTKIDSKYVYTIEGNTSDMVAERQYALTSTRILGYALPDYKDDTGGVIVTEPQSNTFIYEVKKGDTVFSISRRFGVSYDLIKKHNELVSDVNKIYVGQELILPCKSHTVKKGETLFSLAVLYKEKGSAYTDIALMNMRDSNDTLIYEGEVLKVPLC